MDTLYKSWFVGYTPFDGIKPETWIESDIYSISDIIYGAPFKSKLFNTEKIGKSIIRIRDLKEQTFVTYTTEEHPKGYSLQYGTSLLVWMVSSALIFGEMKKLG